MELFNTLKVNTPNVVHETIDGETILLDLHSGNYYSLEGAGAVIWEYIDKTGNWKEVIDLMSSSDTKQKDNISNTVTEFVGNLIDEKLLVESTNGENNIDVSDLTKELVSASLNYKPPKVNKYSDMQDLLLLDPIHDVDEKGWPEVTDTQPDNDKTPE